MKLMQAKLSMLGLKKETFGRMIALVDYGNVNYWFEYDERDWEDNPLQPGTKLIIDIEKLGLFLEAFCERKLFYYGFHPRFQKSWHILIKADNCGFVKVTKPIQFVRHYLDDDELRVAGDISSLSRDEKGVYIRIPKSNFDVEMAVDAIRLLDQYDTLVLLSGDADFARLAKFVRSKKKKVVLIAAGKVFHTLRDQADLYINAQAVKAQIASIKGPSSK